MAARVRIESLIALLLFASSALAGVNVHALATDDEASSSKFVAPGRRKLFIDRWRELAEAAAKKKSCMPILDFADVGASPTDLDTARARLTEVATLCGMIEAGKAETALRQLDKQPRITAYALASIIALTRLGRWKEAEERWFALEGVMRNDIRYGAMSALIGMHRQNWDEAEAWLRAPAEKVASWQDRWERKLIAEEYFFVLVWKKEYAQASAYALRVAKELARVKHAAAPWWYERAGDAELLAGHANEARRLYESAGDSWSVTEKLADVAFLLGDAERERELREKLYGTLK